MKPLHASAFIAIVLAAAPPAHADSITYRLDAAHTRVTWEVRHFGTSTQRGRFDGADGFITLDREQGTGEASISIPTGTVSSGVSALDGMLRGNAFLAADAHPTAYFVAHALRFDKGRLVGLTGEFTLRGVSRPLTLAAQDFGCREDPQLKREVCGGDFAATLQRSQFGLNFAASVTPDDIPLLIQVEAIRQ